MSLRLEDLPPGPLRDQALAKLGTEPKPKGTRKPRTEGMAMVCRACGERIDHPSESALNRHGCSGRYECDLEAP